MWLVCGPKSDCARRGAVGASPRPGRFAGRASPASESRLRHRLLRPAVEAARAGFLTGFWARGSDSAERGRGARLWVALDTGARCSLLNENPLSLGLNARSRCWRFAQRLISRRCRCPSLRTPCSRSLQLQIGSIALTFGGVRMNFSGIQVLVWWDGGRHVRADGIRGGQSYRQNVDGIGGLLYHPPVSAQTSTR